MSAQTRSVGDLHLATVVVNVEDLPRAVRFWSSVSGYQQRDAEPAPHFVTRVDPWGRR